MNRIYFYHQFCDTKFIHYMMNEEDNTLCGRLVLKKIPNTKRYTLETTQDNSGFGFECKICAQKVRQIKRQPIPKGNDELVVAENVSNISQQSSTVLERTLPNPNEVDIIRCALAMALEDFFSIEIVQKCEMSKPDVSNMKAMKRAVSLEKALAIVSKMNVSEKFVLLMSKLMEKKLQMMK